LQFKPIALNDADRFVLFSGAVFFHLVNSVR